MEEKNADTKMEEKYSGGYSDELLKIFKNRGAFNAANFFIRYLKPDMNVLDCGCGPGTITMGLSEVVAEGSVVGIDIEQSQVEMAEKRAKGYRDNVRFETGNVYKLQFPDEAFDAVFANALFQHLQRPMDALSELKRVLKPGGLIAVRDDDEGGIIIEPFGDEMETVVKLLKRYIRQNGGDPQVGRKHRGLLRRAGFHNIKVSATCEYDDTQEEIERRADLAVKLVNQMTHTAIEMNWSTSERMKQLEEICRQWGRHPDAFNTALWCEAIGWKEL